MSRYRSDYLSKEQMHALLLALPGVLLSLIGEHNIVAMYGWAVRIHNDLTYVPMQTDTRLMQYLIEDSIAQRIVVPGECDFYFNVPESRLDVMFCHECDIHLNGTDDDLLRRFLAAPPFLGLQWHPGEDRAIRPAP